MDYYKTLGVARDASVDEIKAAYRDLAKKYHPDANNGSVDAENKFKEISEAYSVLSDNEKRAMYDMGGNSNFTAHRQHGGFNFHDIFNDFFGGHQQRTAAVRMQLNVPLSVAILGGTVAHTIEQNIRCDKCKGTGVSKFSTCDVCKGSGHTNRTNGIMNITMPCNKCNGIGKIPLERCSYCRGSGVGSVEHKNIAVNVEAGVRPGATIIAPQSFTLDDGNKADIHFMVNVVYPDVSRLTKEQVECIRSFD